VKRKRYTEDLEFKISDDDDSGDDSATPKSPSQQQVKFGVHLGEERRCNSRSG